MLERLFLASPWIAASLNVLAYALHYYLSIYETRLYLDNASDVIEYEGVYQPPPGYETIVARQRLVSWHFIGISLVLGSLTVVLWWATQYLLQRPDVLTSLMGAWLLLMGMLIIRDLGQIALFRYLRSTGGSKGAVTYSERLYYLTSAVDYQVYAAFYFLLFFVSGDWFFLGGALMCYVAGRRRRDWGLVILEKYPNTRAGRA